MIFAFSHAGSVGWAVMVVTAEVKRPMADESQYFLTNGYLILPGLSSRGIDRNIDFSENIKVRIGGESEYVGGMSFPSKSVVELSQVPVVGKNDIYRQFPFFAFQDHIGQCDRFPAGKSAALTGE